MSSDRFVTVPGGRLAVRTAGRGPDLALAHGGPGLCDNLAPVAALVQDLVRVHRYDQRGCGQSTEDAPGAEGPAEQTVAGAVADLDAVRADLQLARWAVGGHSWGAQLALFYAAAHPDRVTALVLIAPAGLDPTAPSRTRAARMRRLGPVGRARVEQMQEKADHGDAEAAKALARLWWRADLTEPWAEGVDFEAAPLYPCPLQEPIADQLHRSQVRLLASGTLAAQLAAVRVPALVVRGEHDPVPREGVRELASLLPHARLVELPGAGHSPWLEAPDALADALRGFAAELGRSGERPA